MSERTLSEWKEHAHRVEGVLIRQDTEITALRAALDQERADNEKARAEVGALRAFAQSLNHRDWARQSMFNHGLVDSAGNPTALLSGRGEGKP